MNPDVIVIGAGIVGAACAHYLTNEKLNVTLIEPNIVGGGATAAGMGHLLVLNDNKPEFNLTRYSRDLWTQLSKQLPPDVEYDQTGTLWVAADEEELRAVSIKLPFLRGLNLKCETLDAHSLAEAEPNLRPGLAGALRVSEDALIYPPRAAAWLMQNAKRIQAKVTAISRDKVTLSNGAKLSANRIIAATGQWAAELMPWVQIRLRKGHLVITDRYPGFVRHALIELGYIKAAHGNATESVAFNAQPRKTGQILIGSSRQFDVTHTTVDNHMLRRMLNRAVEYMPAISSLSVIRTWTGFRAVTPDHLPLIGAAPDNKHVLIATGHEGIGITTSLGTACILRDMILGRLPAIDPTPFAPNRL